MENPEVFTVNPAFLNEVWKDNECNLFDFSFELNEDGSMKSCSYKWEIIDPNIWAWIFLIRHEYIKQKRKAESNYSKKIKAVEKREEMKEMLDRQTKKQIEHRKQIDYKDELLKFTDALNALKDPNVDAKIKNKYLKNIIDKIEYERSSTVRITKHNSEYYGVDTSKGLQWYTPPYKIKLKLKYK